MARSRTATFVLVLFVAPVMALFAAACGGGGGEQTLIRNYFSAARLNDRATLANIAMVAWNTDEDGAVSGASVQSVSEPQSRPLRTRALSQALADTLTEEEAFNTEKVAYQDENFDAINRVLAAERDGEDVARRDVEIQEAWTDWRNRTMEHSKVISDAQAELNNETNTAALSVFDPRNPLDLTQYEGEVITKDVSITADVELNGSESEQSMTVTLLQAILTADDGTIIEGRWVVANID